ncbi:MAG: hypothetical protein ACRDJ4_11070 [Actinomycetota bacterium]
MGRAEQLAAYVAGGMIEDDASLSVQEDALIVDGWWPAAVRLGRNTHLVRLDQDGPELDLPEQLASALAAAGLTRLEGDWPLIEAITLQRLGLLGAQWDVWAPSQTEAEAAIGEGAAGEGALPSMPDPMQAAEALTFASRGAERARPWDRPDDDEAGTPEAEPGTQP